MSDTDYCYPPDYAVLRNKLGIRDAAELDRAERRRVAQRLSEAVPRGDFDLDHLKAIHHHLFQDVYAWAGQTRTIEIAKDGALFQFHRYIAIGMGDVRRRLVNRDYLEGLSPDDFAREVGRIVGDVNYVHPFREGNGRTQFQYLDQLATRAGHPLNPRRIEPERWLEASRAAHVGDYDPLAVAILGAIDAPR